METLSEDIEGVWEWALGEYGLSIICSCECEDIELIPEIWSNGKEYLPEWIQAAETCQDTGSCLHLGPIYKPICAFMDIEDAAEFVIEKAENTDFFSSAEKSFLADVKDDVLNESLDTSAMKTAWLGLPSNSLTGNEVSLIVVETIISTKVFIDSHPTEFPDGPHALVNKIVGILGGGVGAVVADCVEDIYRDTGYGTGPGGPWGAFKSSFAKGAIVGAICSL